MSAYLSRVYKIFACLTSMIWSKFLNKGWGREGKDGPSAAHRDILGIFVYQMRPLSEDEAWRWRRPVKESRYGLMLPCWRLQPVVRYHLRLVYRWSGLFLTTEFGCKRALGLLQKQQRCHFLLPITQHFFHICVHTLVLLCGQKKKTKFCNSNSSFSVFFFFFPQSRVDGYSCQRVSASASGRFTHRPTCPGAEKLILGSLKCLRKQALMDETARGFRFFLCVAEVEKHYYLGRRF